MRYSILIFLAFIVVNSFGNTNQQLADSAEIFYKDAKYLQCIENYEKVISNGQESASLYYNLGNAYYKSKEIPMAILYYEKAKVLAPNDEDITFNLRLAKTQTIDKIESIPVFFLNDWFNSFTKILSTNLWAYLSIFAFLASLSLLLLYLFSRSVQLKKISFWSAAFLLFLSLSSMISSYNQKKINFDKSFAVITNPSVNIKSSPDENSTSLFILHSGTKLEVLDKIQSWYKIKIEDGNTGWIKFEDVQKI